MPWNSRTTLQQREELVAAILSNEAPVTDLCRRYHISRKSAYKFLRRFRADGRAGLRDRVRGRKSRTDERWVRYRQELLKHRRRKPTWGARKLPALLQDGFGPRTLASERTINRWLKKAGLAKLPSRRVIRPAALPPPPQPQTSEVRWTFDWKGWFLTGDGSRYEPLTVRDDASRYVLYARHVRQRSDGEVRRICRQLFKQHGVPGCIRVDLGAPFCGTGPYRLTSLSLWWHRMDIRVEFVERGRAIDNNRHENMHRVLKAETATPPAPTMSAQHKRLQRWRECFNHVRPNDALDGKTPAQIFRSHPAPLPPLRPPTYPKDWHVSRVRKNGAICLLGISRQIGRPFAGLNVGCKPRRHGYDVYCGSLLIGILHPSQYQHLQPIQRQHG